MWAPLDIPRGGPADRLRQEDRVQVPSGRGTAIFTRIGLLGNFTGDRLTAKSAGGSAFFSGHGLILPRSLRCRERGSRSLVGVAIAGCAAGPDFRRPAPPAAASYTTESLPVETAEAKGAGGAPQRFIPGQEIPSRWWGLFRSEALGRLIRQGLADSPTLAAAHARLREAEENRRAQAGALWPRVDGNASGGGQKAPGAPVRGPGVGHPPPTP